MDVSFKALPGIITLFLVIAIVIAITGGTLGSVQERNCQDVRYFNTTGTATTNASGVWSNGRCVTNTTATGVPVATSSLCISGCGAVNATEGGLVATNTLANWQPTWAIVIAAVVILGLVSYFWVTKRD